MRLVVAIVAAACAVSFLCLGVASGEKTPRKLNEAEMKAIIGKIGDGCSCDDTEKKTNCNPERKNYCATCVAWALIADPTCEGKEGLLYTGAEYYRCILETTHPTLTCHDGTSAECYATWDCENASDVIYEGYACEYDPGQGREVCVEAGGTWRCRYCQPSTKQEDTIVEYTPQDCS